MAITKLNPRKRQSGLSMVELMIAMVIGLIVTAGVLQLFVSTLTGNRQLLEQARLETELTSIAHFMANDIRRAGYWGDDAETADWSTDTNPFVDDLADAGGVEGIAVDEMGSEAANSCILYSYNLDNESPARIGYCDNTPSGTCPISGAAGSEFTDSAVYDDNNMEMFGYRLASGVIQMRTGPVHGTDQDFTCDNGVWAAVSDNDIINIDSLSFGFVNTVTNTVSTASGTVDVEQLTVSIRVEGSLQADSDIRKEISTRVKLGNVRVSD